jgi:hypothetical protein
LKIAAPVNAPASETPNFLIRPLFLVAAFPTWSKVDEADRSWA